MAAKIQNSKTKVDIIGSGKAILQFGSTKITFISDDTATIIKIKNETALDSVNVTLRVRD